MDLIVNSPARWPIGPTCGINRIPMKMIQNIPLRHRLCMAPIASITEPVFLQLLDELGGVDILFTELISAEAIVRRNERTLQMLRTGGIKTPLFLQLFGHNPESIVKAARYVESETSYRGIDLNMGCPVPKVVRRGAGAALLAEPKKVKTLIRLLRKKVQLPISAKIRLGFDRVNAVEIVKILEGEGIDAISVHFRLRTDPYTCPARWEYAPLLRGHIHSCFIGNGDVSDGGEVARRLRTVDCVMIGRAAVKDPLIFSRIAAGGGDCNPGGGRMVLSRFLDLLEETYDPKTRLLKFKAFIPYFFSQQPNIKPLRSRLYRTQSYGELKEHLGEFLEEASSGIELKS